VADYLFGREMLLVASPRLLASRPLNSAADVAGFPLLEHPQVADAWPSFFARHGLDPAGMSRGKRHEVYTNHVRGPVCGLGLGQIPALWVQDEIARGELVNPLALGVTMRQGYHFLVPESKQSQPALVTLRAWILAEAQGTPGAAPAGLRPAPLALDESGAEDDEEP
jgi:DNA-binding transcriptional LysR family regulator